MWGFLVASRCIFILIMTLLDHRNTATTKKLDFKNSNLTSVEATNSKVTLGGTAQPIGSLNPYHRRQTIKARVTTPKSQKGA